MPRLPVLALACLPVLLAHAHVPAAADEPRRSISVSATGMARAQPDTVHITAGVATEKPTAREALDENSAAMTRIVAALKEAGIAARDIQTTNVSVHARYKQVRDGAAPVIDGYRVVNTVRIAVREVGRLGNVLDRIVSLGSNEIGGIEFSIADPEAIENEARKNAMASAAARAKLLAEAAGARVGKVVRIAEESRRQQPRPMYARAAMAAPAADVPIEAGEHAVAVEVTVVWELD
jgi:uncharacterized protein YggE